MKSLDLRRPPNRLARWAAAHPVLGALVTGLIWGGFMAAFGIVVEHESAVSVPIALVSGLYGFGPLMVWSMRRVIPRWDAEHPAG